jgi:hypothetical protein
MRAEGGFIISAERKAGKTTSVKIKASADRELILKDPFNGILVKWNRKNIRMIDGSYVCKMKAGDELTGNIN